MRTATPAIVAVVVTLLVVALALWVYIQGKKKKGEL